MNSWNLRPRIVRADIVLLVGLLGVGVQSATASAQLSTFHFWVHADSGDDSWAGTRAQPFKRLNHALEVAWHTQHPSPDVQLSNPIEIHLLKSTTPYANVAAGSLTGFENVGWMTTDEVANGCNRRPFPIRMIDNVDIIGVADAMGNKPVITIIAAGNYTDWTVGGPPCSTSLVKATVEAASNCKLEGVLIDGLNVINSAPPNDWPGVFIGPVLEFEISGCDVRAWHDELCFDAGGGTIRSVVKGNSTLADAWPLTTGEGHASVWVRGPGNVTVEIRSSTISGSHDAVEVDGFDASAVVSLTLSSCNVSNNENGIESVGAGACTLVVESCMFSNNFNRPGLGTALNEAVAAIANRGMTVTCSVRRSQFMNNAVSVLWNSNGGLLDLGTETPLSPGENSFCLNYGACIFPVSDQNAYRTTLWQRGNIVAKAAGNYWLAFNQGAFGAGPTSGQNGRFLIGTRTLTSPDNLTVPPGPGVQCTDLSGQQFKRNFSIDNAAGSIDFGSTLPDFDPLPPACPICGTPCPP